MIHKTNPNQTEGVVFLPVDAIARRWGNCSEETVRRIARREGWTAYRMGGRVVRYRLTDVTAYEERSADAPPSYRINIPSRYPVAA